MIYSDAHSILVRSELAAASGYLTGHSETVMSQLHQLRTHLDTILEHWRGGANVQFTELKAEWDFAANGLFNVVLGEIAHALHINWINYQDAESSNMHTWSRHR